MQGKYSDYWDGFTWTDSDGNLFTGKDAVQRYEESLDVFYTKSGQWNNGYNAYDSNNIYDIPDNTIEETINTVSKNKNESSVIDKQFWKDSLSKLNNEGNKQSDYVKPIDNSDIEVIEEEVPDPELDSVLEQFRQTNIRSDNMPLKANYWTDPTNKFSQNNVGIVDADDNLKDLIRFPKYNISDYTNTLFNWRKQTNPFGTKGFFYFKIYFNFNTNYGLLGGIKNVGKKNVANVNTAFGYLNNLNSIYGNNKTININDRCILLRKFVDGLSYVSEFSPWFFKEVGGLTNIRGAYVNNDDFSTQEKVIQIKCSEESVDMRLGTLFDMYKFCVYDNMNLKEIIPSNLRKFEMSIVFFHVPLKKYHTQFANFDEKRLDMNNTENLMSFKMFTFMNCEFDVNSLNEFSDNHSNENIFDLGKNTIKIKYDRVFENRVNEWENIGFGQEGLFVNGEINKKRLEAIEKDIERILNLPKYVYNYKESELQNRTGIGDEDGNNINPNSRYNTLYFENKLTKLKTHKFVQENLYGNFTDVRSKYYLDKLKYNKEGTIERGNIYGYDYGRTGEGQFRTNTEYLNRKLDNIKFGTINRDPDDTVLDERFAEPNMYALSWNAEAIRNSNNMYAVDGIQTTKKTWLGRLGEATWKRTKAAFGF